MLFGDSLHLGIGSFTDHADIHTIRPQQIFLDEFLEKDEESLAQHVLTGLRLQHRRGMRPYVFTSHVLI